MKKYSVYRLVKSEPDFRQVYNSDSPQAAAKTFYQDNKEILLQGNEIEILVTWGFMGIYDATYTIDELKSVCGDGDRDDSNSGNQPHSKVYKEAPPFNSGVH